MRQPDLAGMLEICIRRIRMGSSIDEALADFPEQAAELRRLLQISMSSMLQPGELHPLTSAQVESRRQFLDQAAQLKQRRVEAALWSVLSLVWRNLSSVVFAAAVFLLAFVALGSARALPGDRLYSVKLAAEQLQIDLAADPTFRAQQQTNFAARRVEEVKQMIQMRRSGAVTFSGFLLSTEPQTGWQVAGVPLRLSADQTQQTQALSGVNVEVKGWLDSDGQVQVETLRPLLENLQGTLTNLSPDRWVVSGQTVRISQITRINGVPHLGSQVQAQVARLANSDQLLAISVSLSGGTQISPTRTATPTSTDTAKPTPTEGNTVTPQPKKETPVAPQVEPTVEQEKSEHETPEPSDEEHEKESQDATKHNETANPEETNHPASESTASHPEDD